MPTALFFTDVVGNESVVKGALILVQGLQFRTSGLASDKYCSAAELETLHVYRTSALCLEDAQWDHLMEAA